MSYEPSCVPMNGSRSFPSSWNLGSLAHTFWANSVLPDQAGAADKGGNAPFDAVFGRAFGQRRPVRPTAADDAAAIHVHGRVARVHAPDMGTEWDGVAVRVHLSVIEVVVALRVRSKLRVVLRWREHERCAAAPPAHQLRGDQFLLLRRGAVRSQEIAEGAHVLVHPAIGEKAAVPRQDVGLRQWAGVAVFIRIPEEELARLERRACTGRRLDAHALDLRLRHAIAIAEMIVRIIERRSGLEIECRERFHPGELRRVLLVLAHAALPFSDVTREEDHDRVEVRAGKPSHPVIGMIGSGIAKDRGARRHPLTKLVRKRGQRGVVDAECTAARSR